MKNGYVHSFFSGGMVDGPGIRTLVFLTGCPLRCKYCHNPDTWEKTSGIPRTLDYVMDQILKYRTYYKTTGGGVTISGGEPFAQSEFLTEILKACKSYGIHTALDTSGYTSLAQARETLRYTDLLLLDVKGFSHATYKNVTGAKIQTMLEFFGVANEMGIDTWIRYVLVPGLTDNLDEIKELATFLSQYEIVKKVDVLPFHKVGEHKWEEKNIPYTLTDTQPPSEALVAQVREILRLAKTVAPGSHIRI